MSYYELTTEKNDVLPAYSGVHGTPKIRLTSPNNVLPVRMSTKIVNRGFTCAYIHIDVGTAFSVSRGAQGSQQHLVSAGLPQERCEVPTTAPEIWAYVSVDMSLLASLRRSGPTRAERSC
jgi:hypothetical protein